MDLIFIIVFYARIRLHVSKLINPISCRRGCRYRLVKNRNPLNPTDDENAPASAGLLYNDNFEKYRIKKISKNKNARSINRSRGKKTRSKNDSRVQPRASETIEVESSLPARPVRSPSKHRTTSASVVGSLVFSRCPIVLSGEPTASDRLSSAQFSFFSALFFSPSSIEAAKDTRKQNKGF